MDDPHEQNKKAAEAIKAKIPRYREKRHMSGLNGLKHRKRAPEHGGNGVPALLSRKPEKPGAESTAGDEHAAERKLMDDIWDAKPKYSLPRSNSRHLPKVSAPSSARRSGRPASDSDDLLTLMAGRLAKLENAQKAARKELVEKDHELLQLKRKLEGLQGNAAGNEEAASQHELVEKLQHENEALNHELHEMKQFLKDYGLVWVGNKGRSKEKTAAAQPRSGPAGAQPSQGVKHLDMKRFEEKIKELNALAGEGQAKVVKEGQQARLIQPKEVPITMFRDGFLLWRGPFRSYREKSSQAFLKDILDGYFPYEFKDRFPDGVVFKLYDRVHEDYEVFRGEAKALKEPKSLHEVGNPLIPLSKEEFLGKISDSAIKDGALMTLKRGIQEKLESNSQSSASKLSQEELEYRRKKMHQAALSRAGQSGDSESTNVTPTAQEAKQLKDVLVARPPRSPSPVVTRRQAAIKVKFSKGGAPLQLHVSPTTTVAKLAQMIAAKTDSAAEYELKAGFPPATLDAGSTVEDVGLVPNGIIMAKQK